MTKQQNLEMEQHAEKEQDNEEQLSREDLANRIKEAEKSGLLLCMTDCEIVNVTTDK